MQETVVHIFNSKEEPVDVWFEPWASALLLKPNAQFRLVARSEREGELQIDYLPGRIMVYGWPGCTVQV
jgi:hypothetical protein